MTRMTFFVYFIKSFIRGWNDNKLLYFVKHCVVVWSSPTLLWGWPWFYDAATSKGDFTYLFSSCFASGESPAKWNDLGHFVKVLLLFFRASLVKVTHFCFGIFFRTDTENIDLWFCLFLTSYWCLQLVCFSEKKRLELLF